MTRPDSAAIRMIKLRLRFPESAGEPLQYQVFDSNGTLQDHGDVLPPGRGGVLTFLIPEGNKPADPFVDPFAPAAQPQP